MRVTRNGFNLIEVVVGTMLFVTIFAGLAAGWILHDRGVRKFRDRNIALSFAQGEIERCVAEGFRNLEGYAQSVNDSPAIDIVRSVDGVESSRSYQRSITVVTSPSKDIKELTVRVAYRDDRNEEREVKLETSIFYSVR